jgi:hypothetical protein
VSSAGRRTWRPNAVVIAGNASVARQSVPAAGARPSRRQGSLRAVLGLAVEGRRPPRIASKRCAG